MQRTAALTGWALLVLTACGGDEAVAPPLPAPTVTSISPTSGTVGTELTITGTNFRSGASVMVGTFASTSVDVENGTTIFATVPSGVAGGQTYPVTVVNADQTASAPLANAFTAVAPTLSYVNGATKPSGPTGSTVILEGAGFGDLQGTGQVRFADGAGGTISATIASPDDWTDSFIITTVPSGAATGDVTVQTATGTSAPLTFTVAQNATFSPATISWSSTAALAVGLSGHRSVFASVQSASSTSSVVYTVGGADSTYAPRTDVSYATIQSDGTLDSWTATASLPQARAFHGVVAATPANSRVKGAGYLYVLGGATAASGSAPEASVLRGTINADKSVSDWTTVGQLPAPLHSAGVVLFRGDIYVMGGSTTGNVAVATVYRARLDSTGAVGAWQTLSSLPFPRSYAGVGVFGGFLYSFGGDSGTVTPNDSNYTNNDTKLTQVAYARIDLRSGNLASAAWTVNANNLTKAVSKHTAVIAGGNVLISAGLYSGAGTGSSEQLYAQINSDGSVASFNGATGSRTINSAGGNNLFNHAGLSYTDASGVAHVLILGGDDVNAPGKKRGEVWFY